MKKNRFKNKKRVVVKIGSSSLTHPKTGNLDFIKLERLVRELCDLRNQDIDVCLVSSGAIAVGRQAIGLQNRPEDISTKQACAAVGQARLMMTYQRMFAEYNQTAGQILMTKDTMLEEESCQNAQNTFEEMFRLGIIPVVNENDSVSSAEIETGHHKVLGDNDTLSAIVAALCHADLLVLLSDIDGLYDADPRTHPEAQRFHRVEALTPEILEMAGGAGTWRGTGGMATKLSAARIAMESGCDMVITNGARPEDLYGIVEGQDIGTRFLARKKEDVL